MIFIKLDVERVSGGKIGCVVGKSTMADRQAGSLRWGRQERNMLRQYLENGQIDFTRLDSANYIDELAGREAIWSRHLNTRNGPRNLRQNIRRGCNEWRTERDRQGRRGGGNANPGGNAGGNGGNDDDDDDDDDDLEDDPDSECFLVVILI